MDKPSNPHPRHQSRRTWLIPAIVTFVAFIGGVTSDLVANYLDPILKPYRPVVWIIFGLALIIAVVAAIYDARKQAAPSVSATGDVQIGGVRTQAPVHGDATGGDKITVGDIGAGAVVAIGRASVTVIQQAAAAAAVSSLHQLPSPPRDFTGRKAEMAELESALEKGGVTTSGVQGMGGVGKTALALKLAEKLTPRYPDAQFYLDLKGTTSPLAPAEAMTHLIRGYHPEAKLPESQDELCGLYRSVLHGQRALLLMDNARDAAQVEPLLPPDSCVMLVTSRWHFTLPGLFAKNLDTLPLQDARALLLKIAPRIGNHADSIAQLCGCLPLALRLAGSALAERPTLTVADYIRRLQDARTRLELVEASLASSCDLLAPEQQRRWAMLSIFPATFDRAGAAFVWGLKPDAAQDALDELVRYSLIEWDATTSRYSLHDLLYLLAAERLPTPDHAAAQSRHAQHYADVIGAANQLYLQGGESLKTGLALFDLEWPNIQAGQAWAAAHVKEDDSAATACNWYAWQGPLLGLHLHPRENIRWQEAALAAAQKLKNREAEGAHLDNLGNAYWSLGDARRAIEFYEQAKVIAIEIGDKCGEGNTLGNLGNAYADLGDAHRAIGFYEQAKAIAIEIGDRRSEGNWLGNLGNAFADLGDAHRAIGFYEQQLAITREIGDRRGEGNVLGGLGGAYYILGNARRAIEFYEKAIAIEIEIGDRRGEGNKLGNLGIVHKNLGDARRAIEFYEQAKAIAIEIGDRRNEGNWLWNMALALDALGKGKTVNLRGLADLSGLEGPSNRQKAIACAKQALAIYEQIQDPHADIVRKQLAEWQS